MRTVTLYSTEVCQSCEQVKALFAAREIPYEEIVVASDSPQLEELAQRSGMMTLPQVYIGSILLGGGDATMAAAGSGMLDDLLED